MIRPKTKFDQPDPFQFGSFKNDRGLTIRYGHMNAQTQDSKGTLVMGPGYGETIEKYFELINDLTSAGYDIWIIDWAGQGGSARHDPNDSQRSYDVENFVEHHRDDLHHLVTKIISPPKNHKLGYLGFSLGGHIGLRFMEQYHYIFDVAALNSTLMDIGGMGAFRRSMLSSMLQGYRLAGKGSDYVPGGGPWGPERDTFLGNRVTHDYRRFCKLKNVFNNNSALSVGNPRINWVHNILPSLEQVNNKSYLQNIRQPVFMSIAGADRIVSVKAQRRAIKHLFNVCAVEYKNARHEIWIEADNHRKPWLNNMLLHIETVMKAQLPPVRIGRRVNYIHPEHIDKKAFPCVPRKK